MDDEHQELNYCLVQKFWGSLRENHGSIFNVGLGCVISTHRVGHHAAAAHTLICSGNTSQPSPLRWPELVSSGGSPAGRGESTVDQNTSMLLCCDLRSLVKRADRSLWFRRILRDLRLDPARMRLNSDTTDPSSQVPIACGGACPLGIG